MHYVLLIFWISGALWQLRAEETLYPFLRGDKWGYINATGAWVIEPQFERCIEMFEGDRVCVWQGTRWGYIDRTGKWIVKPQFNEPCLGNEKSDFEIVTIGKKRGILGGSGQLVLPVKYEEICIFDDRAWVRAGTKLGLFSCDGHWMVKLTLDWPLKREMPRPTEGGVSWFKRGKKWGLFSRDGKVLFEPQFDEHVMGEKEAEEWNHPEGLDFKNGRAWAVAGEEYRLMTTDGRVLFKGLFEWVNTWTDNVYIFANEHGKRGLISKEGAVILQPKYSEISKPTEGIAIVTEHKKEKKPDGNVDEWWIHGYIAEDGKMLVEPGTYTGPRGGGETASFSDGLAPVWDNSPDGKKTHFYDPRAGYIDRTCALVISDHYRSTESFSEGLGAVSVAIPGRTSSYYYDYLWGYVQKTGAMAITPQFGDATPFCRDRAWVLKAGCDPLKLFWAMIDRTGKVLTDFTYGPPEAEGGWLYDANKPTKQTRWRGDFAIISHGDFLNGLATADGKILVNPIFTLINEFHDGVAVAVDSRGRDEKGDVKNATALITEQGGILANDTYTEISDFDHGVAWATHRWSDRGPYYQHEGWGLVDTKARELCELKYVNANWVRGKGQHYAYDFRPVFYDELTPVALTESYQPNDKKPWLRYSWGYMNRAGKIVAWHNKNVSK